MKPIRFLIVCLVIVASTLAAFASSTDGTIDAVFKYAWSENLGWINFGTSEGNVHITSTGMTGYAWSENAGWISLNCSNTSSCATVDYKVTNDGSGRLGGYAWSENAGWINFSPGFGGPVTVAQNGNFGGYAWGENFGWISFNCSNTSSCATVEYYVDTDYQPATAGGGTGSSPAPSTSVSTSPSTAPSVTPSPSGTPFGSPTPVPSGTITPVPTPISTPPPTLVPSSTPPPVQPPGPPGSTGGGGSGGAAPGSGTPLSTPSPVPVASSSAPVFIQNIGEAVSTVVDEVSYQVSQVSGVLTSFEPIPIPEAVTEQAGKIIMAIPGGEETVTAITAVTVTSTVTSTTASLLSYVKSLLDMGDYFSYLSLSLFQILAFKRRSKPWGTVYDSVTKKPIPFAKVQLLDENARVLETKIADANGRYGFLIANRGPDSQPLKVQFQVTKSNYSFPSMYVTSSVDTVLYSNAYRGGLVDVDADRLASFDLPMDPLDRPIGMMKTPPSVALKKLEVKFVDGGFWLALGFLPLQYLAAPHSLNLITLLLFLGFLVLRVSGLRSRSFGTVTDTTTGHTMPFSLITLNDLNGQRVNFTVSDELGRYFMLVQKGEYDVVAYTSTAVMPSRSSSTRITTKKGWISQEIKL